MLCPLKKIADWLRMRLYEYRVNQIRISRLNINSEIERQNFMDLYENKFPYEENSNYSAGELLKLIEEAKFKHIVSDCIILVAKYNGKIVGFIACFYYPERAYGMIGYYGVSKSFEYHIHVGPMLLQKLRSILTVQHKFKLIVYELEYTRDLSKSYTFNKHARELGFVTQELDIEYYRPKLHLDDIEGQKLMLVLAFEGNEKASIPKEQALEILKFIHFDCYGDYYEVGTEDHKEFQNYISSKLDYYKKTLPDEVRLKPPIVRN